MPSGLSSAGAGTLGGGEMVPHHPQDPATRHPGLAYLRPPWPLSNHLEAAPRSSVPSPPAVTFSPESPWVTARGPGAGGTGIELGWACRAWEAGGGRDAGR